MLEANDRTFRTVVTRRFAYSQACPAGHVDFERYLRPGAVDGVPLRLVALGAVRVTSGRLIAADPFAAGDAAPFERALPPGEHPLSLAVGEFGEWGERVAFADLRVTERAVARWQAAEYLEERAGVRGPRARFQVDSGLAFLADAESAERLLGILREYEQEHPDGSYFDDVLAEALPETAFGCVLLPDPASPANILLFHSGLGDGGYLAYWGFDDQDQIARLVVDLQLFDAEGTIFSGPAGAPP